jgi:hypothetical protein
VLDLARPPRATRHPPSTSTDLAFVLPLRRDAGLAEGAPAAGGRKREMRRICDFFEVAYQRLQDIMNAFATRASHSPLDANILGIFFYLCESTVKRLTDNSAETDNELMRTDTDSDMPSSAPSYSWTHPPQSNASTTLAPSPLPTPHNSIPSPILLPVAVADVSTTGPGTACAEEHQLRRAEADTCTYSMYYTIPVSNAFIQEDAPIH